jgi:antirestriction protein ArdC
MKLHGTHTAEVAERIVNAFRNPDRLPQALAPIFIDRKDDVPCRKWSWHNQLIVALCGTTDARGFRQWADLGRHIKKGSHALWILAPCIKTITEKNDRDEEVKKQIIFGFKSVPVFAVEDTEGDPLPEQDNRYDSWVQELPLLEVAKTWGITVGTYTGSETTALGYFQYGNASGQAVMLGVENLSTWSHEMVHAADHRLAGSGNLDRAHKEIVAELGSAVLLECLGLHFEADLGGAYSYIQRYAAESKRDVVSACIEVPNRVCNCVKLILDTAEQLEPVPLAANA